MRTTHRLIFAGTLVALAGCTTLPGQGEKQEVTTETPPETEAAASLPEVKLTPQLMYKLLTAEFAGHRGALRLSADLYLQTAEETRDPRLAQRATHIAIYAGVADIALNAAQLWVELSPDDLEARQAAAALLIRHDRSDEARTHLQKILAAGTADRARSYLQVANLLSRDEDKQRALSIMEQLIADRGNDPDALYALAQLAHDLEAYDQAEQVLGALLAAQPKHTQALLLLATVQHNQGKGEAALKSLRQALQQDPDNDQMRLTYARMLIDARHLAEARKEFVILNKRLPGNSDVLYALGLLALEAGDTDDAAANFNKLINNSEHEEEARYALGQIAEIRNRTAEALEWYQSVPRGERFMDAQLQAARLIAREDGIDAARQYLQELPLSDADDRIQRNLAEGELLSNEGHYEEAMAVYDEALVQHADDTQLLYARAMTAEKIDRLDILEQDLKRILSQDPDNSQALNALGYTLTDRTDRHQEALKYIEQAYNQHPEDPAILDSMGWVLYHLGRLDEALTFLEQAAEKLQDGEVAAHLGEVLWVSGQKEEAKKIWDEALNFAPEHKVLQQTIERFNP